MSMTFEKLPYGIASFEGLIKDGFAYVDKTRFIEILEDLDTLYPIVIRPRRFGKSLVVSMLKAYYDQNFAIHFSENFQGTYIEQNPTPLKGKYCVLRLDFSAIDIKPLEVNFCKKMNSGMHDFFERYPIAGCKEFLSKEFEHPAVMWLEFCNLVRPIIGKKLYLLIDEYDQFANDVLASDRKLFELITSKEGFIKNFYAAVKDSTDNFVARTFITGVTPITLDSITSGFNIACNISGYPGIAEYFGFTPEELRPLIDTVLKKISYRKTTEEVFFRMKDYYNGYRFSKNNNSSVFNASMCLYYLNYIRHNGAEPDQLSDPAVSPDIKKINGILSCGNAEEIHAVVKNVLSGYSIPIDTLNTELNLNKLCELSRTELLSVFYYLGYLTYAPEGRGLVCPNKAIRESFFNYFVETLEGNRQVLFGGEAMNQALNALTKGDIAPFIKYAARQFKDSVRLHAGAHLSEAAIQYYFLGTANRTSDFVASIEEEAAGTGYVDLVLKPAPESKATATYLLEFKYLPKTTVNSQSIVSEKLRTAQDQLTRYASSGTFCDSEKIVKAALVFVGTDLVAQEITSYS